MSINKYKLVKKLGQGAFGITYLAEKNNQKFVIKQIDYKKNRQAEIDVLKKIEKYGCEPDILCYEEDFKKGDFVYIVTKAFLNSMDLKDFLFYYHARLSNEQKMTLISNITNALYKLHTLNIAHLDIKPDNILINTTTLNIQIIDFGITCDKEFLEKCIVGGTIDHHSPELLETIIQRKKKFNIFDDYLKSDIFSLGILFYEILYNIAPMDEYGDDRFIGDDYYKMVPILLEYYKKSDIGLKLKESEPLDNLISEMVSFDKNKRPDIQQVKERISMLVPSKKKTIKVPISSLKIPKLKEQTVKKSTKVEQPVKKSTKEKPSKKISIETKPKKKCSDDKELNPKTNRCIKKCKTGYVRNPITNRCVKQKKQ